jgi:amino acid adenylation domain-containing protein
LAALANGSDQRLHMILFAGYLILLSRYTGQEDLVVGTPTLKQTEAADFVNTALLLRCPVDGDLTFKQLVVAVRGVVVEATKHQNYPVETLPEQLGRVQDGDEGFPLLDTALLLESIHDAADIRHLDPALLIIGRLSGERLMLVCDFDDGLYEAPSMTLGLQRLAMVLEQGTADLERPIAAIQLATEEEKRRILDGFNNTDVDVPPGQTVQSLVRRRAEAGPDRVAVAFPAQGNQAVTYGELLAQALSSKEELADRGVGPGSIVPICLPRSIEMVVAILGALEAGCAYLPLDVHWPEERIASIVKDCGPPVQDSSVDEERRLLYVVYTSGSTGRPKGGMVEQRGFVNLIHAHQRLFGDDENMRASQVASPGFDAMAFEVWPCLAAGGTLILADDDTRVDALLMKDWLISQCVTISYQPTVLAQQLTALDWTDQGIVALQALRAAGDRLTAAPEKPLPFKFYNLYGPTETTVWSTWLEVEAGGDGAAPSIGRPLDNHRIYIVDRYLNLQPAGVPGEMCIGGVGVARGYLNRPELTDSVFTASPFEKRIYRTGDLARWLPDGCVEFLGRVDHQVKIRGFRIELGEIQHQLERHPAIRAAAVVVRRQEGSENLCACVEADESISGAEVREFLGQRLPDYMVPPFVVRMEALPMLSSGKVDRRRLEVMNRSMKLEAEYAPPQDDIQRRMALLWGELLDLERVGIDDNFFTIGGDSIKTVRLLHRMEEEFAVRLKTVDLYQQETIRKLAPLVREGLKNSASGGETEVESALRQMDAMKEDFLKDF